MHSKILVFILVFLLVFSCSKDSKKIIFIANSEVDCSGETTQKCLQIREDGSSDWTLLHTSIEGFDYQKGFFYKLKVHVTEMDNPSAEESSLKYTLIAVLDKSTVPLTLDRGSWFVTHLKDLDSFGRNPFIKIDLSNNLVSGNTGCNRFSGKITVKKNRVSISEISATEMRCKDSEVEDAFLKALEDVRNYSLNDEKLQFLNAKKELVIECEYLKSE